jgi:molybdate transport repressor ModE-like protein
MYVSVEYKFSDKPTPNRVEHPLLTLLESVHAKGSIAGAAEHLGRSYRYVWGELKHWEVELDAKLVVWGRCSGGAELTVEAIDFLRAMSRSQKELEKNILEIKTSMINNSLILGGKTKPVENTDVLINS